MSPLEETLKTLIAKDLGVPPEQVTAEFVRHWRADQPHPQSSLEFGSHYGGYRGARLRNLSLEEIETNRKRAEAFLEQFDPQKKLSTAG